MITTPQAADEHSTLVSPPPPQHWSLPLPQRLWAVITALALVDTVWLLRSDLTLTLTTPHVLVTRAIIFALCLLVGLGARWWGPLQRFRALAVTFLQLNALTITAGVFSYFVVTLQRPCIDAWLVQADSALGVDYVAWFTWVHAHPGVAYIFHKAYDLTAWLLLVCLIVPVLGGAQQQATTLLWQLALALLVIVPVSGLWPAQSAWVTHGVATQVSPDALTWWPVWQALHTGTATALDPIMIEGIITFPSFHTATGILATAALWRYRRVFPLACLLNGTMLLAVPTHGGHYVSDIFAGALVAGLVLWMTRRALTA